MPSILERLRAERTTQTRPETVKPEEINLTGSGFNKKTLERSEKAVNRQVAQSIKANEQQTLLRSEAESDFQSAIDETIAALRAEHTRGNITLDDSQIAAVAGIMHNQCSILIGAAGTGKTTVTGITISELAKRVEVIDLRAAQIVSTKDEMGKNQRVRADKDDKTKAEEAPAIAIMAYTGRAAQQAKQALPQEWHRVTTTIHAGLAYAPEREEVDRFDPVTGQMETKERLVFRPGFNEYNKLPYRVYVFDESGMIPIPLWNEFIAASNPTDRILLVGDINQLPPTHGKSVLGYAMRKWPVFELSKIHRQAAGSSIIMNAHNVLNGRPLENGENFHIIGAGTSKTPCPSGQGAMKPYILKVVKRLHELGHFDPFRDAIIVPQNKGMIGQIELNEMLVTMFNPEREEGGVIVNKRTHIHTGTSHVHFAIGDKVMITSNINTIDPPITNGMIGLIESLNVNGKYDTKRAQVNLNGDDDDADGETLDFDMDAMAIDLAVADDDSKGKEDDSEDQRQASHVMLIKFNNGQTYTASTAGDFRRVVHGYAITCHKAQGGEYPNTVIVCHSANAVMLTREWLYTALTRARKNVYLIANDRGLAQALKRQVIKGMTLAEKIRSYLIETKSDDDVDVNDRMRFPILWNNKEV